MVSRIAAGATVLRGRCLPYGDGITFWPLRVMLGAADVRDDDKPEEAQAKLMSFLGDRDVVDRVAVATGLSAGSYPLHEIYWGARKVLEILAARGPVVVLVDDIHWAETAFLDLLDHVLSTSTGAPILLLATARHDLLEERPQWGEQSGASRIVLRPLSDAAAAQVVANLLGTTGLPQDVLARIVDTAEGNPLYVEQLLSMLIDRGALLEVDGRWVRGAAAVDIDVPPTIHALLEARLDQLGRAERATVEPAAVIGLEFPQAHCPNWPPGGAPCDRRASGDAGAQAVRDLSVTVDASARTASIISWCATPSTTGCQARARACTSSSSLGRSRQCRSRPRAGIRGDPRLSPRTGARLPGSSGRWTRRAATGRDGRLGSCRRRGVSMRAATSRRLPVCFDAPLRCLRRKTPIVWR